MKPSRQSGNVIFMILIFIVLFVALSYAVSQAMRGGEEGTDNQKATLAATEIITFGNSMATTVAALKANGCTDTQITFEGNNGFSKQADGTAYTYTNANAPSDKSCHVFDMSGGGITPKLISKDAAIDVSVVPAGYMHPQSWIAIAQRVSGNGSDSTTSDGTDLVFWIGRLKKDVCKTINDKLGITNPSGNPPLDTADCNSSAFAGAYSGCSNPYGDTVTALNGKKSFCVDAVGDGLNYTYIQVLLAR